MPLLTPGAVLRYDTTDGAASAAYCFQILATEPELVLTSAFADGEPDAIVRFTPAALAGACTSARLSQGRWRGSDGERPRRDEDGELLAGDLPPFVLAREALRELRAGATQLTAMSAPRGAPPVTLRLVAREVATIEVDAEPRELTVLHAAGDGVRVRVIDDDAWPVIVERIEGDARWHLQALTRGEFDAGDEPDDDLADLTPGGLLAPTGPLDGAALLALARRLGATDARLDHARGRFLLLDAARAVVLTAAFKIVLVALPGGLLQRAHVFADLLPDQVLGPLDDDDPLERPGTLAEGRALAEPLALRAGADALYPEPLGPMYVALFEIQARRV